MVPTTRGTAALCLVSLGCVASPSGPGFTQVGPAGSRDACGVQVAPQGDAALVLSPLEDGSVDVSWGYSRGGQTVPVGTLPAWEFVHAVPLLGFPDGSQAWVRVSRPDCSATVDFPIRFDHAPLVPDWTSTQDAGLDLAARITIVPVATVEGAGFLALDQVGQIVWQLLLGTTVASGASGDPTSFGTIRRARINDGRLTWMVETDHVADRCRFRSVLVGVPEPGADAEEVELDTTCHHDWAWTPAGEVVFPSWDEDSFAEEGLLIDRISRADLVTGEVTGLMDLADHVDVSQQDIATMQAVQATIGGAASSDTTRDLTYVNGGTSDRLADGGYATSWLVNLAEEGIARVVVDATGTVRFQRMITDDPSRSDYRIDTGGVVDHLLAAPHGLGCVPGGDKRQECVVFDRNFTFPSFDPQVGCSTLARFTLDDQAQAVTVRWSTAILDGAGDCVPSTVHGNANTTTRADGRPLHTVLATGDCSLTQAATHDWSPQLATLDDDGTVLARLELEAGRDDVQILGFMSGPYAPGEIATGLVPGVDAR